MPLASSYFLGRKWSSVISKCERRKSSETEPTRIYKLGDSTGAYGKWI